MKTSHEKLIENMLTCIQCDLSENRSQVVVGDYGPKQGLCFVGEAPGAEEDRQGRPFVGRSGQLLDTMLGHIGLDRRQVSVLNIVKCRPPSNRNPTKNEQKTCGSLWLQSQLSHLDPTMLVTLGSVPLNYFYPGSRITRSKGKLLTDATVVPVYPMFHPAYVLRGGSTRQGYRKDFVKMVQTFNSIKSGQPGIPERSNSSQKPKQTRDQSSLDQYF